MLKALANEGVIFDDILIDRTFPEDNAPTRKPGTGMLTAYMNGDYDLEGSYVIGDRLSDAMLARNLGAKAIILHEDDEETRAGIISEGLTDTVVMVTPHWDDIIPVLQGGKRCATVDRKTSETDIHVRIDLDGNGHSDISTGLGFFDHMLDQIARHSGVDLTVRVKGDLHIDEHHTIEDTAIALGTAINDALGDKRGIERYGFVLPMDECLCTLAMDFGGRPWIVWDVEFNREKIGDMPTEMFFHFFKSLSDNARMNLFVRAEGANEHHKIEGIFKAFAKSLKQAVRRDPFRFTLPSTKGVL